jgi:hypothetical protein
LATWALGGRHVYRRGAFLPLLRLSLRSSQVRSHAGCTIDLEIKGLRGRRRDRLLELDEVERRLKPFGRRYLGVRAIPLDALVGTDGRANSFTRDFRPLHAFSRDRLRSLESAFTDGGFPPIVRVKLGEAYFVIDGHHRAALARRGGAEMIDADVTELIARVPLPAGADMLEVVLRELERIFLEDSGLAEARPGVRVPVGRPAHYLELLENVQVHGYHMMRVRGRVLENTEIAANWYDAITRRHSPRSTVCASAASTGTRRPATCSSFSTGTGEMLSLRPAARTSRRPSSQ